MHPYRTHLRRHFTARATTRAAALLTAGIVALGLAATPAHAEEKGSSSTLSADESVSSQGFSTESSSLSSATSDDSPTASHSSSPLSSELSQFDRDFAARVLGHGTVNIEQRFQCLNDPRSRKARYEAGAFHDVATLVPPLPCPGLPITQKIYEEAQAMTVGHPEVVFEAWKFSRTSLARELKGDYSDAEFVGLLINSLLPVHSS